MPRLSDTMEEGTIAEWLKKEGDKVEKGDVLLEIETDKATMTQESYEAGVLEKILVQAGQTVPIGTVIAIVGKGDGSSTGGAASTQAAPAQAAAQPAPKPVEPEAAPAASAPAPAAPTPATTVAPAQSGEERLKASPLARRIAAEQGIPLENIKGSGPGGRILKDDVLAAEGTAKTARPEAATPPPSPTPTPAPAASPAPGAAPSAPPPPPAGQPGEDYEDRPVTRMRQTIARRLTEAKQQIPHIYISNEIDMGEAMKLRQTLNAMIEKDGGVKVTVNDLVVKAVAKALKKFPVLNSSWMETTLRVNKRINVSIAVALEDGLFTPVIRDADQKSIGQLAAEARSLIERARASKLRPDEYQGGTFSVSNLGMYDVTDFVAVINPPNVGILAVGAVKPTPVVSHADDQESYTEVTVAQVMKVTISVDHRAADGAVAAQFLQELKRILQNPMGLLI
jgi:pyruvate dehydrogenase E2 component (dihydrolipoamide acetyltransferase)